MAEPDEDRCRLYLITPPAFEIAPFVGAFEAALAGGDVACLQLRLKDVDDETVLAAAAALRPVCHAHDVALIVNDRPDLAAEAGADGVHVGQEDAGYEEARRLLGDDAIVGVTCHDSIDLAIDAAEAGADYVAFGAFFDTGTKEPKARARLETLARWAEISTVPCVAIGGITVDNCRPLLEAGADFLAVVAGVWSHPEGPGAAVEQFNKLIETVGQ